MTINKISNTNYDVQSFTDNEASSNEDDMIALEQKSECVFKAYCCNDERRRNARCMA